MGKCVIGLSKGQNANKKYLIIMKVLILLCLGVYIVLAGRILSGDVKVDYANAGSMTQLSFSFMLSNTIMPTDYLLVALPFPFHSQLIPAFPATEGLSSPLGLLVTYQYMDNSNNLLPTVYYTRVLTGTIDSSNYYVQFYAADRKTIVQIPANQWFSLTLKIQTTTPLAYQTANSVLQIQLSTVSSVWPNAMVYDDNLAFNYFQLAASPSQLITLASTPYNYGASGGYLLIQQSYYSYLDVTLNLPSYYYNTNLVLKFLISQKNTFAFNGTCSSVAKTNAPKINALASSLYTCSVDTVNNIVTVKLTPAATALQQSFRFSVNIVNPITIAQGVSIVVNAMQQNCNIILGYGTASGVLSTNQLYVTSQQIYLGWGLRPDALLPFDARIYRGNSATPSYMPFNSLSLKFSISQSTSSLVQLKVVINIPSESAAFVLPSSFSTNLPAFSNKQVVCVTQYASSTTNRRIGCSGVGALTGGTMYSIGWKMFFPYDNYQSAVNCSQFGLLTIYTTTSITASQYAYYLGRGDDFLSYLKNSSNFVVIGRNSTYINYMTTFPSINLVVRSSDFQQFLSQPESIYINNRPPLFLDKTYNDVYVITQNLAFLTYINLFTDIYCAVLIPQNTDIVNGYGTLPIVATTTPKNTLTITTSNSQDWTDYVTDQNPLVSSVTGSGTNTPGTSLLKDTVNPQSLVFNFKAAFSSVTSFSSTASTPITNQWGMLIMMSPSISFDTATSATISSTQPTSNSLTPSVTSVTDASAYNQYTLVTLTGSIVDHLQNIFKITAAKTAFGLYPFRVNAFSSIYADSNNQDIMIATVDGINGPANKMTYNGYFLINAFTQSTSANTINMGFINYQSSTAMTGSQVPTMLRIKGTVTNNASAFDSLIVFFDTLTPFFSNYHAGEINCYNSDNTAPCRYQKGPLTLTSGLREKYNYMQLSRFEIPLNTPVSGFNILIPVTFPNGQIDTNFYVAYQVTNTITGYKSLAYVEPMRTISISYTASVSGNFGPVVSSATVGQTVTNLQLRATSPITLTPNAGNDIGSTFTYFSQWDYFGNSGVNGFSSYGTCATFSYLYYTTNYAAYLTGTTFAYNYQIMKGIVCSCDLSGSIGGLYLVIPTGYIPSMWGITIPGYGAISDHLGQLRYLKSNYYNVGSALTASTITYPPVGPNMVNAVGVFAITLPVQLDRSVQIVITGGSTNLPFTFSGTCAVYYNNAKTNAGCNFVTSPTTVTYTLTILETGLIPSGAGFAIVHYGLTSNSSYNTITTSLSCYSLLTTSTPAAAQLIFSASSVSFPYSGANYIGPTTLSLGSFTQWTANKAVVQSFNFSFTLLSKGLYVTNRVRFNLGQFASDNSASSVTPTCKVYTYSTTGSTDYSHDFAAIDTSGGLTSVQLWPAYNLLSSNLTYTLLCNNFLSTSSPTPISLTAMIANTTADLTGQVSQNNSIALPVLGVASTTCQISLTKSFSIPSIAMEMNFLIISPGISLDSFLYINFPYYYSSGLGQDIKCYTSSEIYCYVNDRFLTVQYMGVYTAGVAFTLTIAGVVMPINYNSGTFSFVFDNDNNPNSVLAAGTFIDTISSSVLTIQNFPTINIFAATQSSAYLRDNQVTLTLTFYLQTSLSSIGLGQSLFLVFPATYYDVLRFVTPTCTLNILGNTLKNYVSTCSVRGMRIKMPFLDNLVLGSTYTLTVGGLINPTNPSSNVYLYSLQITDSTATSVIAKSYSLNCNYLMPAFISNPTTVTLNYYRSTDNSLVTLVNTMANIMSSPIYIAPLPSNLSINITTEIYERNTYLSPLSSLLSNPANIDLNAGQNPFPIQLSALTSGVNYLYFSKTGDGQYYSNLPPLILTTSKNYFTALSFVQNSFTLPVNTIGSPYSVIVTLSPSLVPMSQVSFTVTLSSSVGISLTTNPTVVSFYPGNTIATIALYINDATQWVVSATTNLVFTPTATTTSYATGTTVTLTAVAAPGVPVTTFTFNSATTTSLAFNMMCSEQGSFIYHLSRSFTYNASACALTVANIGTWLAQSSLNGLRVSQSYYKCEDVIGAVAVTANVSQVLNLSSLQSSTSYQVDGYCQTIGNVQTALTTIIQSTNSNGGLVSSMVFYFATTLTTSQKIKLVCALALKFGIDYTKVSTWDGYYCSELLNRRLLQEEGQPRQLTTSTVPVTVYFGVNTYTSSDTSQTAVTAAGNTSSLVSLINSNVTGLPLLTAISSNAAAYIGPNNIAGSFSVGIGPNFVYLYNLQLQHNGIVYVIIGDNSVWTRAPVISQIKTGSGPNGLPPVYFRVLAYTSTNSTSANMGWTGLGKGSYTLYLAASDSNPFDTATFGNIYSYPITSEIPSWETITVLTVLALFLLML